MRPRPHAYVQRMNSPDHLCKCYVDELTRHMLHCNNFNEGIWQELPRGNVLYLPDPRDLEALNARTP